MRNINRGALMDGDLQYWECVTETVGGVRSL